MAGTCSVTHVRNSDIKTVATTFFRYALRYWLDIWYVSVQIKFTFRSGPMTFGRVMALWLKFCQIVSCHHFFSLCLEILTWLLAYECIVMSYRSSLHFVPVQWFLAELWPLDFENLTNIESSSLFFTMIWDIDLIFGMRVTYELLISYRSTLKFVPVEWFLANLQSLGFDIWQNI